MTTDGTHPCDEAYAAGRKYARGWTNAAPEELSDIERQAKREAERHDDPESFMDGFWAVLPRD